MALLIIILVAAAAFVIITRNSLIKEKNRIETAEVELEKYEAEGTQEDVDNAKKYLNAVIRDYNNKVESFPTNLVAELFNFPKMHTYEFDEGV